MAAVNVEKIMLPVVHGRIHGDQKMLNFVKSIFNYTDFFRACNKIIPKNIFLAAKS